MNTALFCVAMLGFLLFCLGFAVSMARARAKVGAGTPGDPSNSLHKLVRAHGNTAEYTAMLALLIFLVGSRDPANWAIWFMVIATASRYLIVIGLIVSPTIERPHPVRFLGALGTYVGGFALSVALLLSL